MIKKTIAAHYTHYIYIVITYLFDKYLSTQVVPQDTYIIDPTTFMS